MLKPVSRKGQKTCEAGNAGEESPRMKVVKMRKHMERVYSIDKPRAVELLSALANRYLEDGLRTLADRYTVDQSIRTLYQKVRAYHRSILLPMVPDTKVKLDASIFPAPPPRSEDEWPESSFTHIILKPNDGIGLPLSNEKAFGKGSNSRVREA